jgi:hypothetical protein
MLLLHQVKYLMMIENVAISKKFQILLSHDQC